MTCNLNAVGGTGAQELPNDGTAFTYVFAVSLDAPLGLASLPCAIRDDQDRSTDFSLSVKVLLPLNTSCNAVATPISSNPGRLVC